MTENNCRAGALTSEQSAILIACAHRLDEVESQYLAEELRSVQRDLLAASPVEQHEAAPAHSDDAWVDRFATELKSKLAEARAKGRGGWETCDPVELSRMLREHVEKGDPRDVANFCLFLWALGKPISDAALPMGRRATAQPEPQVADERAALPRYTEWLHLRAHGEWSNGVPAWARDHNGRMNDTTAAIAVIEELAARASSPNAAGAEGADERAVMGRLFEVACDALGRVAQALGLDLADTRTELILDAINELKVRAEQPVIAPADALAATPAAKWRIDGEPDPHGTRYDCERAALTLGTLTDDELANAVFMHGNERPPIQDVIAGTAFMPIVYLTAAKERIRWLSRALETARASSPNAAGAEGANLPPLPDPARTFADHSDRAFSRQQMIDYALSAISRATAQATEPVCWITKEQLEQLEDLTSDAWVYWRETGHVAEDDELALYAAPQPVAIPAGYALVPIEPTQAMLDCWWDALPKGTAFQNCTPRGVYAAMIATAPPPPAPASAPVGLTERQIADTVNTLRDVAIRFHDTQQLRERIAAVVTPLLKGDKQ